MTTDSRCVDAVVVNYNGGTDLLDCLASLRRQDSLGRVIVVDNGSDDGSDSAAELRFPDVTMHRSATNLGYAGGANLGARITSAEMLLFLNPDVVLGDGCVAALADSLARRPGVAAPVVHLEAMGLKEYGSSLDRLGQPMGITDDALRDPLYVSGCALATDRHVFDRLGGFDQRFFMFMEDADYCWRTLLGGYSVSVVDPAHALHRGGGSTPGGYLRGGRLEVSPFRLLLRERNTLAMLIKCAPAWWLPWILPAYLLRLAVIASALLLLGRVRAAGGLLGAAVWNLRQLRTTLRMRRQVGASRATNRVATVRLRPATDSIRVLFRHGMPRIVESKR